MIANYYTLFHLTKELDAIFRHKRIKEIFSQQRRELVITFQENTLAVIINCEPSLNCIYMQNSYSRAHKNSIDIFPILNNCEINHIELHQSDRQINMMFKNGYKMLMQMFGSKANVLLVDIENNILSTFLKTELSTINDSVIEEPINDLPTRFRKSITQANKSHSIKTIIKQLLPKYGNTLIHELLFRCGLEIENEIGSLTESDINMLTEKAQYLNEELINSPSPRIYYENNIPKIFSIINLHHLNDCEHRRFDSISKAIHTYKIDCLKTKSYLKKINDINDALEKESEKNKRTIQKIQQELNQVSAATKYEYYGNLLLTNLNLIQKGNNKVRVQDLESGNIVEIPIEPNLTPAKNAERYFEKAKKAHRTEEEQKIRLENIVKREKQLTEILKQLEQVADEDTLKIFIEENKKILEQFGIKTKDGKLKKEETVPFRVFTVDGGYQVWVGKNSENNDLLTTKHTAKNDLWFHVRGVGGSHVVLKVGTKKEIVSKKAIEQTASIAAYYSKMKNAKMVPVTMCEGKYVRKPKGYPAGTVRVEREKTIFVEPGLPSENRSHEY